MYVDLHNPTVKIVRTLGDIGTHSIRLRDPQGGELVMFIRADWSDWDAIVEAVANHRAQQEV